MCSDQLSYTATCLFSAWHCHDSFLTSVTYHHVRSLVKNLRSSPDEKYPAWFPLVSFPTYLCWSPQPDLMRFWRTQNRVSSFAPLTSDARLKMCHWHIFLRLAPCLASSPAFWLLLGSPLHKITIQELWSPQPDLNRWPLPYQGSALPTKLCGHILSH